MPSAIACLHLEVFALVVTGVAASACNPLHRSGNPCDLLSVWLTGLPGRAAWKDVVVPKPYLDEFDNTRRSRLMPADLEEIIACTRNSAPDDGQAEDDQRVHAHVCSASR